mgnify:CR=1 FL=1
MAKSIFIPGNVPSSKNGRVWTGRYSIASKATRRYWKESELYWIKLRKEFTKQLKKLEKPYKIKFTFIRKSKHKFDYINPCQTVQDLMVKHKWLEDDNCDIINPVFGNYKYDKDKPGVIIKILK